MSDTSAMSRRKKGDFVSASIINKINEERREKLDQMQETFDKFKEDEDNFKNTNDRFPPSNNYMYEVSKIRYNKKGMRMWDNEDEELTQEWLYEHLFKNLIEEVINTDKNRVDQCWKIKETEEIMDKYEP